MSNNLDGWLKIEIPELTIEQQFETVKARSIIESACDEDLRLMFMDVFVLMLKKDNILKKLLSEKFDLPVSKIHGVDARDFE